MRGFKALLENAKKNPAILSNKQRSDNIQKDGSLRANQNNDSKLEELITNQRKACNQVCY